MTWPDMNPAYPGHHKPGGTKPRVGSKPDHKSRRRLFTSPITYRAGKLLPRFPSALGPEPREVRLSAQGTRILTCEKPHKRPVLCIILLYTGKLLLYKRSLKR